MITAHLPGMAVPSMQFLLIDPPFRRHVSSQHSATVVQIRFTSFAVTNLRHDFHPHWRARARHT